MENTMIDGFIYTVRSKSHPELVYYGSTIQPLSERMSGHRASYKMFLKGDRNGCTSYQIVELGDAYIELVEAVRVPSKQHMKAIEGRYQRENDCVNKNVAGRTDKEYGDAYNKTPARKASIIKHRETEGYKEKSKAYNQTPAAKARHSAYKKTPEAKAKAKLLSDTPEAKAKKHEKYLAKTAGKVRRPNAWYEARKAKAAL
jgi:hypothetical protein